MLLALLWFAVLLALYTTAWQYTQGLFPCRQKAVLLMEASPLSGAQVLEMQEQESEQDQPRSFAAWSQENEVTARNAELNRSHTVAVVTVCGRSDLIMRGSTWLDTEDQDGCLIDADTAEALFGSTEAAGMTIEVMGEEKIVRGLLYEAKDVVLVEADDTAVLKNLTVSMGNGESYESVRQNFMMGYALSGNFLKMDTLYWIAGFLCLLIPLLAGGHILGGIVRKAWARRREKEGMYYGLLCVCGIGLLLGFVLLYGEIPGDMIPTKWSDFDFWKNWWEEERESLLLLLLTEKQKPQQIWLAEFYGAVKCQVLAFLWQYSGHRFFQRIN